MIVRSGVKRILSLDVVQLQLDTNKTIDSISILRQGGNQTKSVAGEKIKFYIVHLPFPQSVP